MKIKRIYIRNYRGIEERDLAIEGTGAIAKGRNGGGKTTLLKAIKAALLAQDIGPDAIRRGFDKAEILVDLADVSVRRVITHAGSRVDVSKGEFSVKKPQAYLTELLGTSSLDPMDLLTLKGKDRRQRVLAALPVQVTVEQLRTWWPKCPADYPVEGHGLEVISNVREVAYRKRTEANKCAKDAAVEAARRVDTATQAANEVPVCAGEDISLLISEAEVASKAVAELKIRREQAIKQASKTESNRARIEELRAQALAMEGNEDPDALLKEVHLQHVRKSTALAHVTRLQAELEKATALLYQERDRLEGLEARHRKAEKTMADAALLRDQAQDLESALAQSAIVPVSDAEIAEAETRDAHAREELHFARLAQESKARASKASQIAADAKATAELAQTEADRLDAIVKALTDEAPAALLAQCDGIPGLGLDGDDVLLDGVRLDALCGAEQVRFCVEVARRANSKSKILVVDGLERLDPDQLDVFVHEATLDDWQLLATRVDRGEVLIEAIEPEKQGEPEQ